MCPPAWQCLTTHKHHDKGDNLFVRMDNFTTSSILIIFSAFRLSSLRAHERGFKRQTLCQWRGRENCSDEEVAQRTVNRILRGRDTCSYSKVEHYNREKRWLCRQVGMWSIEDQLHFNVWYRLFWWWLFLVWETGVQSHVASYQRL